MLWKPELSNKTEIPLLVNAKDKQAAVNNISSWLKHQDENTRIFFTGTKTPVVADCIPLKEEIFGVIVI